MDPEYRLGMRGFMSDLHYVFHGNSEGERESTRRAWMLLLMIVVSLVSSRFWSILDYTD